MKEIVHPLPEDIDSVFEFMVQCDIAEFGAPDASREDLEKEWSEDDLQKDIWIARDEGRVCGYAVVGRDGMRFVQDIYIHPTNTPEGVEDRLVQNCIDRFNEWIAEDKMEQKPAFTGYVTMGNHRLQQAYERAGFIRHTYHYQMRIDLAGFSETPVWPAEFGLESFKPGGEMELYQFIQTAFDWEGHTTQPFDSWQSLLFRGGRYDPEFFVLVRRQGKLVGTALAYDEGDKGWIRQLAVSKELRGRGVGSLLLRHMFAVFAARGAQSVSLGVASVNETAWQFYERNGMHRNCEFIEYRRENN